MPSDLLDASRPDTAETEGRFELHDGQALVHADTHRFRLVCAGRQWGKTRLALITLLHQAFTTPGRHWYVAPDKQIAKDILWAELKQAVHPTWLAGLPREMPPMIPLCNGSHIALHGAEDPYRLRGRKLASLVLDEYADMKPETWNEVLEPAVGVLQSPVLFIGTPKSFNHFYDLFILGQSAHAEWKSWQFKSIDNPFFPDVEIERARATKDPRTFRQEYEASFETIAGRAYYAFSRQSHVKPVVLQPSIPVSIAFDFNVDPSTATLGQRIKDRVHVWRSVFIRHAGGEATIAAARTCKQLLGAANWTGGIRIYGDPAGRAQKTTGPSDHAVLREVFKDAVWCIRTAAPHVRDRVAAVNGRCETMDGQQHLAIDPHSSNAPLIADLEQVTFAGNGELDQKTNPMLTHISSALGYWIEYEFPPRGGTAFAGLPGLRV